MQHHLQGVVIILKFHFFAPTARLDRVLVPGQVPNNLTSLKVLYREVLKRQAAIVSRLGRYLLHLAFVLYVNCYSSSQSMVAMQHKRAKCHAFSRISHVMSVVVRKRPRCACRSNHCLCLQLLLGIESSVDRTQFVRKRVEEEK